MLLQAQRPLVRYPLVCKRRCLRLRIHCSTAAKEIEQSQVSEDTNLYYIRKCNERSRYTAKFLGKLNKDQKLVSIPTEELMLKIQNSQDFSELLLVFNRFQHQFDLLIAIEALQKTCKITNSHTRKEERVRMFCRNLAEFIQPELRNLSLVQIVTLIHSISVLKFIQVFKN
eukprot:TRINITY_DN12957_c0_g1_i3.p3 TRINITY_DN12957_c0_g1~~TRINITY_DN12957_c0_g1_i3.p3  ORF type:complete len:171 (-),score=1.68 TRINITY_DN12957_c0_g1_i3:77-589(-)